MDLEIFRNCVRYTQSVYFGILFILEVYRFLSKKRSPPVGSNFIGHFTLDCFFILVLILKTVSEYLPMSPVKMLIVMIFINLMTLLTCPNKLDLFKNKKITLNQYVIVMSFAYHLLGTIISLVLTDYIIYIFMTLTVYNVILSVFNIVYMFLSKHSRNYKIVSTMVTIGTCIYGICIFAYFILLVDNLIVKYRISENIVFNIVCLIYEMLLLGSHLFILDKNMGTQLLFAFCDVPQDNSNSTSQKTNSDSGDSETK